ncbi:3-deoxy-D-manno-octulosonic acid transferase [Testudinibacter sp. TR-2022]|uniref:lipid IV(A) 3-deoxy-D-manno-octulosonic acid transferase n=1 Tax=Testudinibacter sp. TR-2022 TaxID=2585029 RepID=UPI00111BB2A8|nr:lipid IV(A) 3-deoxy-D-manno-octulosonic acid transferase [Testudinibacter sp. TR-2022]TNH01161.1 3-deoxy-D-manno-octulosonic acid transferase [Pasteurellaceae bacterium Phil31]TNH10434.1 3-deoxy-D-manno-octulosonic acid transferase [Testudinibacter sp. TR-2022]TNH10728.1 3-deoxy-D-manno-octulosonic acid transferase [Testudinibacter sp. TR-2022]TNH12915.1 3-deoxy-D-manno-octulosonic acid transferase [Testudinibacter sp. TR-2022]TNH14988.1 3-deoxy-D-manno-octulosonic acid transferase [Testudi
MFFLLYNILIYLIQPFILLFTLFRSRKSPAYRQRLPERYGIYSRKNVAPQPNGVLIHAASVGEVMAAQPLVNTILAEYPQLALTITTVTPTGLERVKSVFGKRVTHVYLPYDTPTAMARFIRFVQPKLCIVMETELWPNFIGQLAKRNIPLVIANARLSARSATRYGKLKKIVHRMLSQITHIAAQDSISASRYLSLDYDKSRLSVMGNLKYDLSLSTVLLQQIAELRQTWLPSKRPVWIAASTHQDEDDIILQAHRTLLQHYPDLLLLLVPRHPERFQAVYDLIEKLGLSAVRRSAQQAPSAETQVMLIDSMGELMLMYGISDIAFVGGSLLPIGGHNPLEPLAFKLPVISGKHTFNFPEVFSALRTVNGVIEIESQSEALAAEVDGLLSTPTLAQRYGEAGYQVLVENRGALDRLMLLLRPYLEK